VARLIVQSEVGETKVIDLKMGVNKFGRSQRNDFQLEHVTISAVHCEVILSNDGLRVRDCGSTNGTFVDGRQIVEETLTGGQTLRIGEVALLVESTDVTIAIPQFEVVHPAPPPVVLSDGSMTCPRHPDAQVAYQCTNCHEVMCGDCVHRLRRRGGKVFLLCPICSKNCVPIGGTEEKKKSIFERLQQTIKLPFMARKKP
jgi:hypothetical protein